MMVMLSSLSCMLWCLSNCQSAHSSLSIISSITTHNLKPDTTLPWLPAVVHRRAGSWPQSVKTNLVLGILTVLFKNTIYISFGQMGPKIDICPVSASVVRAGPGSLLDILFLADKLHWPCESCPEEITITIVIFWSLYHPGTVKNVNSRGRYCVFKIEPHLLVYHHHLQSIRFILWEIHSFVFIRFFKVLQGFQRKI